MNRTLRFALISFAFNITFGAYHLIFGIMTGSWWLLTLGSYYMILSIVRFYVIRLRKHKQFVRRFTGIMLMLLSIPCVGTVILSVVRDRGHRFHTIVTIAMAVYAFTRITFTTVRFVKSKRCSSTGIITLSYISLADAVVSVFALQRTMLASFDGMTESEIQIMNAVTGSAACAVVFLLGLKLIKTPSNYLKRFL